MAIPIYIGGLVFPTKAAAKDFFRQIRDSYPDHAKIGQTDSDHLCDLIACHPEGADKIGAGIASFSIATDAEFGRTRHFVVHRTDGTHTDFSFLACIDGRNRRRDSLEALRRAVEGQIVEFRDGYFATNPHGVCPLRGVPISIRAYHVDHAPPAQFIVLAAAWLAERGLALGDVAITPSADNQVVSRMSDARQRADWEGFHRSRSVLRMLSPRGNLSDANRRAQEA